MKIGLLAVGFMAAAFVAATIIDRDDEVTRVSSQSTLDHRQRYIQNAIGDMLC